MKIKTKSGFVCDVNPDIVKDWRFCKGLAKCDSGDESAVIQGITFAVPFLLGEDGERKLIEHVTDKNGLAPVQEITKEFREIITLMGKEVKKSQSSPS